MTNEDVRVSVVIPLHNEESSVGELLRSLDAQTVEPHEVVVVDAGSTDRTAEVVRSFTSRFPLVLLSRERLHPGEARNQGVAHACCQWIAFTDGGIRLEPDWLSELVRAARPEIDVVYGSCEPVCDTFFRECAAIAYVAPHRKWGGRGPVVASMMLRRRAFEAAKEFPPYRAAEDLVFFERLAAAGCSVTYAARAIAHWQLAANPKATFRRFALYSHHNLAAGRGRYWHLGVARLYAALIVAVIAALALGVGAWTLAIVPLFFVARAMKAACQKRRSLPFWTLAPGRILGAALVLVILDIATLTGGLRWIRHPAVGRAE